MPKKKIPHKERVRRAYLQKHGIQHEEPAASTRTEGELGDRPHPSQPTVVPGDDAIQMKPDQARQGCHTPGSNTPTGSQGASDDTASFTQDSAQCTPSSTQASGPTHTVPCSTEAKSGPYRKDVQKGSATQTTRMGNHACRKVGGKSKDLAETLSQLLVGGDTRELDSSFYPILVVSSPSEDIVEDEMQRKFGFISKIGWKVVFDCDPQSNETGLCKLVNSVKSIKILSASKFEGAEGKDVDAFRNDIDFPEMTTWVFPNGRKDAIENIQEKLSDKMWTKHRSKAVQKTIDFYTNPRVISGDRAVLVFMLLSDADISVLCTIFQQFYISDSFQKENFTVIAEDHDLIAKFKRKLEERDIIDSVDLEGRCLVGYGWQDISEHMSMLIKPFETNHPKLLIVPDKICQLHPKVQNEWSDLSVVAHDECENSSLNKDNPHFEVKSAEIEREFYQGHEASWWNFFLSEECHNGGKSYNHVLVRDASQKLEKLVNKSLINSAKGESHEVIWLFHQAGSGGTTVAKHVLWKLHKQIRCAVITRVTGNTVQQISEFRKHGYGKDNQPGPVLLLLDNLHSEAYASFLQNLEKESHSHQEYGHAVIIIHCKRVGEPKSLQLKMRPSVAVEHKLNSREIVWFQEKTRELEKREVFSEEKSPERLLGFMVMKNECKPAYLKDVVSHLVPKIRADAPEIKHIMLLKYIAAIQVYIPDFAMPVSACDLYMQKANAAYSYGLMHTREKAWDQEMPKFMECLCIREKIKDIHVMGLSIMHPKLAKIIVEQLGEEFDQQIPEIFLELLDSPILQSPSHSTEQVQKECRVMMIRRLKKEFGDERDSDFAPFIEDTYAKDKDMAFKILEIGVDRFRDPMIAQQLARLHKQNGDLENALKAIDRALELKDNSSYLWVTKGLILQDKMTKLGGNSPQRLSDDDLDGLMAVFQDAASAFQTAQKVMKAETTGKNYAGFYHEADIIFGLLEIIKKRIKPFCFKQEGQDKLRVYLTDMNTIPAEFKAGPEHHEALRNLKDRVEALLATLEDCRAHCIFDYGSSRQIFSLSDRSLAKLYTNYKYFFGLSHSPKALSSKNPKTMFENRRMQVLAIGASSYVQIFQMARDKKVKELKEVQRLLKQNMERPSHFDVKILVFTSFALALCCNEELLEVEVRNLIEILKEKEDHTGNLYGLFFEMLLNWDDATKGKVVSPPISDTLKELKRRWMDMYQHRSEDMEQSKHSRARILPPRYMKPSTEFYVGKRESRVKKLVYRKEKKPWEHDNAHLLERLGGFLKDRQYVRFKPAGCEPLDIRLAFPKDGIPSEEKLKFYVGFSFAGPVAYDWHVV